MTADQARRFAEVWADAWNRLDLEAVLAHFSDEVTFSSPKALEAVGIPTVRGKVGLRAYWTRALSRIETLCFQVVRILWHTDTQELAIIYNREINGHCDRAIEVLRFDAKGQVTQGEVFYGVMPQ